jgi:XTP/dITP diphosphohydrolase
MMDLWVATGNQGKLSEIKAILEKKSTELGISFNILSLQDIKSFTPPPETGKTFEENARIKTKSLSKIKNDAWVIGEDSGLEVEGLNNMPGVFSARYAGDNARDVENTSKVLKMINLRSAANRKAQFRCVMLAYDPQGKEYKFEGTLKGEIAKDMRGTNGFGYDSIFIPEGFDKTLAELTTAEKNKISHRAQVIDQFLNACGPALS